MNTLLKILGMLCIGLGLLWIAQGTGTLKWPESSMMIGQTNWAYYGAALAVVGLITIWFSGKKKS